MYNDLNIIITGGTLVTPTGVFKAEIGITDGKIRAIGTHLLTERTPATTKLIDAGGKFILPGMIDAHVHFQMPVTGTITADDFETGTRAAARGGVTTVIDYANQNSLDGSLLDGIKERREQADPKVGIDYGLHCVITDWNERTAVEMDKAVAAGVTSFKFFTIYKERGLMSDDGAIFRALERTRHNGARVCVHAENESLITQFMGDMIGNKVAPEHNPGAYALAMSRPNVVEYEAVNRMVTLAEASQGRLYLVHLSAGRSADIVGQARKRGVDVVGETCPQYLLLTDQVLKDPVRGHLYASCPQVKSEQDCELLWQGLQTGDLSIVATDHCSFSRAQKNMWNGDFRMIPYGMPGVETMLPLLWTFGYRTGRLSLEKLVELMALNPAKIHGLYPQKGVLQVGSDADLVIVDPQYSKVVDPNELATNSDYNPYEGWRLWGFPGMVLSRGEVIVQDGQFIGKPGRGKFIKRQPA